MAFVQATTLREDVSPVDTSGGLTGAFVLRFGAGGRRLTSNTSLQARRRDLGLKLLFSWPYYRRGEKRYASRRSSTSAKSPFYQVHPKVRVTARADFGGFGAGADRIFTRLH